MKIKFTVTADFEAEVTEDIAYEVMKDYGGNFDAWMKDNYSGYTCESEFEVEDISYDKKLRQALEKAWQKGYTRGGLDAVSDYTDIKLKGLDK